MAAGVVPKRLNELQQNMKNAIVTALVITKSEPKYFQENKNEELRGYIIFTLRDSRTSICNCKCWGNKEKLEEYNRTMKIGDVIDVVCPFVVNSRYSNDDSQRNWPISTLPIMLVVNDSDSFLSLNDYQCVETMNRLQELMFMPHKPPSEVQKLSDVLSASQRSSSMLGQRVDVLVMVAQIRDAVHTQQSQCLEIVVFDESTPEGMLLSIWNSVWIQRAIQNWMAIKTVLHLIDVEVSYSSYHRTVILRKKPFSIIYENPLCDQADTLRKFSLEMPAQDFQIVGHSRRLESSINPDDIKINMTIKQIYMRLESNAKDSPEEFTAVITGMVSKFDIDGYVPIIRRMCKSCRQILGVYATMCATDKCRDELASTKYEDRFDCFYSVNIQFSDHTGSLVESRLTNASALKVFKVSASDFEEQLKQNETELLKLKWTYLFQRFEVKLSIKKAITAHGPPLILVVAMQPIFDMRSIFG